MTMDMLTEYDDGYVDGICRWNMSMDMLRGYVHKIFITNLLVSKMGTPVNFIWLAICPIFSWLA